MSHTISAISGIITYLFVISQLFVFDVVAGYILQGCALQKIVVLYGLIGYVFGIPTGILIMFHTDLHVFGKMF